MTDDDQLDDRRYVEWGPGMTIVPVPHYLLRQAGWKRVKYPVYRIKAASYLDTETGEIIAKREMFHRRIPVPHNGGYKLIEQLRVIHALPKKTRDLAIFLLKMRNGRGGFVMPLESLIDGYIHRNGTVERLSRAKTVHYKLVGELSAAGMIVNLQTLGSNYQKHGDRTPQRVLEEAATWYQWRGIFRGQSGLNVRDTLANSLLNISKTPETLAA